MKEIDFRMENEVKPDSPERSENYSLKICPTEEYGDMLIELLKRKFEKENNT